MGLILLVLLAPTAGAQEKPDIAKRINELTHGNEKVSGGDKLSGAEIENLIKQLGSSNARTREAATKSLMRIGEDARRYVLAASKSADPEVAGRALQLLSYYDGHEVRELNAALNNGDLQRANKLVVTWPSAKKVDEAYSTLCRFVKGLEAANRKQEGGKMKMSIGWLDLPSAPIAISANRIDESMRVTEAARFTKEIVKSEQSRNFFLRGDQVELNDLGEKGGRVDQGCFPANLIVSTGTVRIRKDVGRTCIIASGNVEIAGYREDMIVLACGSVTITGSVVGSLIIAKGKVSCDDLVIKSRIISGKSVVYSKKNAIGSVINENEADPLGLIQSIGASKKNGAAK